MTRPATLPAAKTCLHCGAEYTRPRPPAKYVTDAQWLVRTFCGNECANAARKAAAEASRRAQTRTCRSCGGTYHRPAKIDRQTWESRKSCSRRCSVALGNATRARDAAVAEAVAAAHAAAELDMMTRSTMLPKDAPAKLWIERVAGKVSVCCGHCLRRFPRATIRQAEKLRDLHRRYCKPVVRVSAPWGNGRTWTEAEDDVVRTSSIADAALATGRTVASIEHRRKKLRSPDAPKPPRLWTPEEDAVLAEIPDATEAALKLGRSRMSVVQRRIRLAKAAA